MSTVSSPLNPFLPRDRARKRIVNVSVTEAQMHAIDTLQSTFNLDSRAAVIKLALAEMHDRVAS